MIAEANKIKKREQFKKIFFSGLLIVFILVIIGFLVMLNFKAGQRRSQLNVKIEALKKEIQITEERNEELKAQVSQASQGDFVEKEAREKLNLKKPGENVVVIVPPKEETQASKQLKTLWQRILEMLRIK